MSDEHVDVDVKFGPMVSPESLVREMAYRTDKWMIIGTCPHCGAPIYRDKMQEPSETSTIYSCVCRNRITYIPQWFPGWYPNTVPGTNPYPVWYTLPAHQPTHQPGWTINCTPLQN